MKFLREWLLLSSESQQEFLYLKVWLIEAGIEIPINLAKG